MRAPITSAQAMLHPTVVETVNALGKIANEHRTLAEMLVGELRYIEGISNGQVQRVAKQALAKLPHTPLKTARVIVRQGITPGWPTLNGGSDGTD